MEKLSPEFPAALRELIDAECAAGNSILEIGGGFPAPPVGQYVKLAQTVSTRPRASGGGLHFYERNMMGYSGEFTDAQRFFFVLEPPQPPPPEPDMDAIRARFHTPPAPAPAPFTALVERFRESMVCTYERWHDGTGYDLAALAEAAPAEREAIEQLLTTRPVEDWRDVEALAALDTPRARALLQQAARSGDPRLTTAVLRHAPGLIPDGRRTALLVAALESAEIYGGLSQALDQVEEYHPPEVIDALWRGVRTRDGETAVHFAAMLMYLHGRAASAFDWELRPFFLRFHTDDAAEREQAYRELRERAGL